MRCDEPNLLGNLLQQHREDIPKHKPVEHYPRGRVKHIHEITQEFDSIQIERLVVSTVECILPTLGARMTSAFQ
jgi:hypothetical protein